LVIHSASSETGESHLLDLHQQSGSLACVCKRQFGLLYDVDHCLGKLYIKTDKDGARSSKLCSTPLSTLPYSDSSKWQDVWVPSPGVHLDSHHCFEQFMVVQGREEGICQIWILFYSDVGAATVHKVVFPEASPVGSFNTPRTLAAAKCLYAVSLGETPDFKTETIRLHYTSYTVPGRDYAYHVPTKRFKLLRDSAPPGYNPSLYRAEQIISKEHQVPISVVYRMDQRPQGLCGSPSPTVLTGYGAYGACQDPCFDSHILSLLDRGVVYAIAHVRGGGELGRDWREEGRYQKVKNRFRDFVDSAETLIAMGISEKSRLAGWGESSGGLLISASMNMRPDLFKAVLLNVPFVDALNTMADPSIPLTCTEWEELGNPNQRVTFYYMLEYSPYDNIRMQDYPAAYVTASLNDSMVGYWEPLKFVSKLRRIKTDSNPVLLKVDFHAGHGGASNKDLAMREQAEQFAFLFEHISVTGNVH